MSVLSKLKRDKAEFLIGQRQWKKLQKKQRAALKSASESIQRRKYPETVDRSFARRVIRELMLG